MTYLDSSSFREPPIEELSSQQVTKLIITKKKELDAHVSKETKKIEELKLIQTTKVLSEKRGIVVKYNSYLQKVSTHMFLSTSKGVDGNIIKKIIPFESDSIEPCVRYAVIQWTENNGKIKFKADTLKVVDMDTETVERTKNSLFYAFPNSSWKSKKIPDHLKESFSKIKDILSQHYTHDTILL